MCDQWSYWDFRLKVSFHCTVRFPFESRFEISKLIVHNNSLKLTETSLFTDNDIRNQIFKDKKSLFEFKKKNP